MIHQLKIESRHFQKIAKGTKTYEIRKNDRDFRAGDYLGLNEIPDHPGHQIEERIETGAFVLVKVLDIYESLHYLAPGYVVMAIQPCEILELRLGDIPVYGAELLESGTKYGKTDQGALKSEQKTIKSERIQKKAKWQQEKGANTIDTHHENNDQERVWLENKKKWE